MPDSPTYLVLCIVKVSQFEWSTPTPEGIMIRVETSDHIAKVLHQRLSRRRVYSYFLVSYVSENGAANF